MAPRTVNLRTLGEIVAIVGVMITLVFVGLELRQNTAAVRGATFQALSDASAADLSAVAHDPELAALLERVYFGEADAAEFSGAENMRLYFYYMAFARRLENSYLQHTAGVIDGRIFESYGWHDAILSRPHFREFWNEYGGRAGVSDEFASFLETRTEMNGAVR
jgi:hypothetical protein